MRVRKLFRVLLLAIPLLLLIRIVTYLKLDTTSDVQRIEDPDSSIGGRNLSHIIHIDNSETEHINRETEKPKREKKRRRAKDRGVDGTCDRSVSTCASFYSIYVQCWFCSVYGSDRHNHCAFMIMSLNM